MRKVTETIGILTNSFLKTQGKAGIRRAEINAKAEIWDVEYSNDAQSGSQRLQTGVEGSSSAISINYIN
jgi:hypothetical protein